jgi:hypothetical protein
MHDPEKSDSGRVAAKPTNKAGRPAATVAHCVDGKARLGCQGRKAAPLPGQN